MMRLLGRAGAEEVVIHLVVDYNVIVSRMNGRRVCPVCCTLYNLFSRPPKTDSTCDLDGARLEIREDDREEVVRARLAQYEAQTRPLIEYFRNSEARLFEVDASRDKPEAVFSRIQGLLENVVHAPAKVHR
jgi:adenylate kinase